MTHGSLILLQSLPALVLNSFQKDLYNHAHKFNFVNSLSIFFMIQFIYKLPCFAEIEPNTCMYMEKVSITDHNEYLHLHGAISLYFQKYSYFFEQKLRQMFLFTDVDGGMVAFDEN